MFETFVKNIRRKHVLKQGTIVIFFLPWFEFEKEDWLGMCKQRSPGETVDDSTQIKLTNLTNIFSILDKYILQSELINLSNYESFKEGW